jgi:hypothetical protein
MQLMGHVLMGMNQLLTLHRTTHSSKCEDVCNTYKVHVDAATALVGDQQLGLQTKLYFFKFF